MRYRPYDVAEPRSPAAFIPPDARADTLYGKIRTAICFLIDKLSVRRYSRHPNSLERGSPLDARDRDLDRQPSRPRPQLRGAIAAKRTVRCSGQRLRNCGHSLGRDLRRADTSIWHASCEPVVSRKTDSKGQEEKQ
jgi:hypothetical protein